MNPRLSPYVQAIRGPVLLVTVGVLFAIHQAGVISFSRTWPLLVIVIGVMKLIERMAAPVAWPAQAPAAGGYQASFASSPAAGAGSSAGRPYQGSPYAGTPAPERPAGPDAGGANQ